MSEYKRGVVSDLNREESRKLRALWDARNNRMTQAEFGQTYGIGSQAAVGHFLNGHAAISMKAAKGFALGLGCEIAAFSPRLAEEAAALGEVSGTGGSLDVMSLTRDEMHLLMLYRKMQPLHQKQLITQAAETLKAFTLAPLVNAPDIDALIEPSTAPLEKRKIRKPASADT